MSGLRTRQRSWRFTVCLATVLTAAAGTLWVFGFALVVSTIAELLGDPSQQSHSYRQFVFRNDGLPVMKTVDYRKGQDWAEYHDLDGQPVAMRLSDEHSRLMTLVDSRLQRRPKRAVWSTRVKEVSSLQRGGVPGAETWFLRNDGERGLFVAWDNLTRRAIGYLSLKGFSESRPPRSDWFPTFADGERQDVITAGDRGSSLGFPYAQGVDAPFAVTWSGILFVEPGGRRVHAINFEFRQTRLIHDGEPVLAANLAHPWKSEEATRAVLRMSDWLRLVELTQDGVGETEVGKTEVIPLPAKLQRAFAMQWVRGTDDDKLVTLQKDGWRLTSLDTSHRVIEERDVTNPNAKSQQDDMTRAKIGVTFFQSPALVDFFVWEMSRAEELSNYMDTHRAKELGLDWPSSPEASFSDFVVPLIVLQLTAIGWSFLAVRRLRRFGASRQDQWFWGVWTLLFGVPGYLAFRAHREWEPFNRNAIGVRAEPPTATSARPDGAGVKRASPAQTLVAAYAKLLDLGEHLGARIAGRVGLPPSYTALALKEFRLTAGLAVLASLAYVVVLGRLIGLKGFGVIGGWVSVTQTSRVPFLDDGFIEPFVLVGFLLAACLAVWQSFAESRGEAWLFVLHRPVSRRAILLSKVLIGLLVVTSCTAWPIVLYAAWAARAGSVAAPFDWGMTELAWRQWAALTAIYLGTLLTMLRPARWVGTRLLPVVAVFGWLAGSDVLGVWCWPVWWELLAVVAIDLSLASSLFLVVREREYP